MKKMFLIILNWNGKKNTLECLKSSRVIKADFDLKKIVIDNGSTDNSTSEIKKNFPDVLVYANKVNCGFSAGYNIGIKSALLEGADYIMFLNNDTILSPSSLLPLYKRLESRKNLAVAGPKIYFASGYEFHSQRYESKDRGHVIWYAGGHINWNNILPSHLGVDQVDRGQFERAGDTEFVSGCAMMIRASVFKKIGLLDERYFLYYEDLDFNIRVKKAGYAIEFIPKAILWHKNAGASHSGSSLQDYYLTRNRLLFGMLYGQFRSKISLIRESLKLIVGGRKWQRKGVIDAVLGRWGKGSYVS